MVRGWWAIAVVALCAVVGAPASAVPALEAYGKLPDCELAAISDSGARYALVGVVGARRRLIVADFSDKPLLSVDVGELRIDRMSWAGDDRILLWTHLTQGLGPDFDREAYVMSKVMLVDVPSRKTRWLLERPPSLGVVRGSYGVRQADHHWYGYFGGITLDRSRNGDAYWKKGVPDLYQVELDGSAERLIAEGGQGSLRRSWQVDAAGEIVAALDEDLSNGAWKLRNFRTKTVIASGQDQRARTRLIGLAPDGTGVLVDEVDADDVVHTISVPLEGGATTEMLRDKPLARWLSDPRTGEMIGYVEDGDYRQDHLFDPVREARMAAARKAFPGLNVRLESWNRDFDRLIVLTDGKGDPGTWWMIDVRSGKASNIASSYLGVQPEDVGEMRMVSWKARDGLSISGVLTLPPGRNATNLPLVVLPHGGPAARDYPAFDWMAQAFASRGYAVLQPNFRGSTGYGQEFERAGDGEWGGKMQTDISDGVDALARDGVVNPRRACIVGASYGGYAALAGVTIEHGRYRCAVAVAGVSDLKRLSIYQGAGGVRNLASAIGKGHDPAAISPASLASTADAPVLLIHGRADTVVPFDQSKEMEASLKAAGKTVELLALDGEDHWLSRGETRAAMLKAAVAFVNRYNPPD